MEQVQIYERLNTIFRDTFDDDGLHVTADTTAHDIKAWDSANHINLIVAIEEEFSIRLRTAELEALKDVGQMVELISRKTKSVI